MKKTLKKALSLFLSIIMLASTLSVGFTAFAASVAVDDAHKAVIAVPETVYMTPSTGASTVGKYYVNNTVSSGNYSLNLEANNANENGYLQFYIPGAVDFQFAVNTITSGVGDIKVAERGTTDGGTYENTPFGSLIDANGYFAYNTIGMYIDGAGLSAGQTALAEWKFTVTMNDGSTRIYYAYSTLYAPYYTPVGAATRAQTGSNGAKIYAQSVAWVSGVHSFTKNTDDSKYWVALTNQTLANESADVTERGTYYAKTSGNAFVPLIHGVGSVDNVTAAVNGWLSASAGTNTLSEASIRYFSLTASNGNFGNLVADISPVANLTVDTSRYTNLNQIPNLTVGFNVTDTQNANDVYWYVSDFTDTAHKYSTANNGTSSYYNYTKQDSANNITNKEAEWYNGSSTGSVITGDAGTATTNYGGGVEHNAAWNRTIVTGSDTYDYLFKGALHTHTSNCSNTNRAYSIDFVQLRATNVNKAELRKLVLEGSSLNANNYISATWEAYRTELRAAAQKLGNPTATDVTTTNLTTKRNALQTTVTLNANGGSIGTTSFAATVGAAATPNYNLSAYTPTRTGYTFKGWSTSASATSGSTTVSAGLRPTLYATWEANKYNVVFDNLFDYSKFAISTGQLEINERTDTGFTVTSTTGTDANTGFSYAIPVTPGKTYIFSADVSIDQVDGDTRGFDMYINTLDANMAGETTATVDTSNGAHKEGNVYMSLTGQKEGATDSYIRFTAGATTAYIKVRFDANTEGNKLTVNNIRVYEDGTIADGVSYTPSKSVTFGSTYGTLPTPTRDGYEFLYWETADGSKLNATDTVSVGDVYVTSKWKQLGHTVIWKNYDGSVLETDTGVAVGATPIYNGNTPTKPATAQYTYTFTGWTPTVSEITGDTTYTAQFSQTTNKYNVTWKVDGQPDVVTSVEYGTVPAYPNGTPTKAADAQYTYTFTGWDTTPAAVTKNVTYTAQFGTTTNTYTVIWINDDNSVLETDNNVPYGTTPTYDGDTPTKASNAQYSYTHSGWTPEINKVTGAVTYKATFTSTLNKYTVNWVVDNEIYHTEKVEYGTTPTLPATPTKAADAQYTYTFKQWNPTVTAVTGDVNYTAVFDKTVNKYTVTWVDENGTTVLYSADFDYGSTPVYGAANPTKAATAQYTYTFAGWDREYEAVTKATTYTATYSSTVNKYTITFVNEDGTELQSSEVEYGTKPAYTGNTPTKEATAQYTYVFTGWDPEIVDVVADATYTAQFESTTNVYTVTWENYDGTVLETDENVPYGDTPEYNGATPTKPQTDKFDYTFADKWSPEVDEVTGDVTYTAQFNETVRKYTITWVVDGTPVKTDEVEYDTVPVYTGATPTREADAQYTYTFKDWSPAVVAVTGPATYVAEFNETVNTYTVTWVNDDNTVLETDENVPYGETPKFDGATPTKAKDAQYTYTFKEWSPAINTVTGDVIYTAAYEKTVNKYTVTWKNENGTVLETDVNVPYGTAPSYDGAEPTKTATAEFTYTFAGWDPVVSDVTGDVTYTAKYTATTNEYTITWIVDGVSETTTVKYGEMPTHADPTKAATAQYTYTFKEWTPEVVKVTGDATYTAIFTETVNTYDVTWVDEDGDVLETDEDVEYGATPTFDGTTPSKEATAQYTYTFAGWDPDVSTVTGDVTYTATYSSTVNEYTIKFVDENGNVLQSGNVAYGETPVAPADPEKAADAQYTYTFKEWSPAIEAVTGEATYTAVFDKTVNEYTITWIVDGVETTTTVAYGETPAFGSIPTKNATAEYTYTFKEWTPAIESVTGTATYTAVFNSIPNKYTVTWVDEEGNALYDAQTLAYGSDIPKYNVPNRPDLVGEWITEYPDKMPAENVKIVARYVANAISVTWVVDEYTHITPVIFGQKPVPNADWENKERTAEYTYEFLGWFTSPTSTERVVEFPTAEKGMADLTYYAKFNAIKNKYTVTWVDEDGTVLETDTDVEYGTMPSFDRENPTKDATAQYTFEFNGWDKKIETVKGDVTYKATYSFTVNNYTVTWENYDGTVLETDENVPYGTTPKYDGAAPEKPQTDKYSYTFAEKWSPEVDEVTGDVTYTAQFNETVRKYTITWVVNGTPVKTDEVEYDAVPVYTGATPSKDADAQYTYTFKDWSPAVVAVTGPATYVAEFNETVNTYTVTWVNDDGTELETDENVPYGTTPKFDGATPTKAATAQYTYIFDKWTPEVSEVTGNVTYKATYKSTINTYKVEWIVEGETVETDAEVPYGTTPYYDGETPVKAGDAQYSYVFTGWTPAIADVTEDATYTATFAQVVNEYTVTWVVEGVTVETDENVPYDTTPTFNGTTPTKAADAQYTYTFKEWSPAIAAVTGDVTYTATFTPVTRSYTITWLDDDGSVIDTTTVAYGTVPVHADPTKAADAQYTYTFACWTPDVVSVTGDATYTATYDKVVNKYTVTWVVEGETVETDTDVEYGATPKYDGEEPTKAATAQYSYTFDKWTPEVSEVTGDVTYTATFTPTVNKYTITWIVDGNETTEEVEYGTVPSIADPTKAADAQYSYTFAGWDKEVVAVTGEATYTAVFTKTDRLYTITWVVGDNTTTEQYKYNAVPSFKGSTDIPSTESTTYVFKGWDKEFANVTEDATYTAQYDVTVKTHTITWIVGGQEIKQQWAYGEVPEYVGSTDKAPSATATYTFAGWDKTPVKVTGDATYTAIYTETARKYTVVWYVDGEFFATQDVAYNTVIPTPGLPAEKVGYTVKWDNTVTVMPANDVEIHAIYTPKMYPVYWLVDGITVYSASVAFGDAIPAKTVPAKDGYTGKWVNVPETMPADIVTIEAEYTARTYSVYWKIGNAQSTGEVVYGTDLVLTFDVAELPEALRITVNGSVISEDNYNYDSIAGTLTIYGSAITGNINIVAKSTSGSVSVTSSIFDGSSSNTNDIIDMRTTYHTTIRPAAGYRLPKTVEIFVDGILITSGYTYDNTTGKLTINAEVVVGDIEIYAECIEDPDYNPSENCNCSCHSKNALIRFFFEIGNFFRRIFGMKNYQYCACGVAHW